MIKNFIKDSLTCISKDNCFVQKAIGLFLFVMLYSYSQLFAVGLFNIKLPFWNYAVLSLVVLVVIFIINGYKVACIQGLMEQDETTVFPYLNIKKNFRAGIKYTLAMMVFYIPLFYLLQGFSLLAGFSIAVEHDMLAHFGFPCIVMAGICILASIFYNFVCLIGFNRIYCETENWLSFVKFKELFVLIKSDWKKYLTAVLILFVINILNITLLLGLKSFELGYLSIVPAALLALYEFYVKVYVTAKFKGYQADQHQLQA
ncbi:MAG: DUF4013 domain-containing protein [Candidatus Gastranaerophilales bacterium]|nr:DUF4013 domain-containing protein [Candidatus Gastranaerophilales bacterium]MCM1072609.1 DUF4013 domain-containing protein [Bacteroides sp.]